MLFVAILIGLMFDISSNVSHHGLQPVAFHAQDTQKETRDAQSHKKQPTMAVNVSTDIQKPTTKPDQRQAYDPRDDAAYQAYLWATILGVGVALVGLWFLVKSANAARDAANAAKESADAAKTNAEVVINAERAWIFADVEPGLGSSGIIINTRGGKNTTSLYIRILCRNVGKNPAWITEISAKFLFTNTNVLLPGTPAFDPDDVQHFEPIAIAPNDPPFKTKDFYIEGEGVPGINLVGDDMPVLYGIVRYRDAFGDGRHTTFGYMLLPGTTLRLQRLYGYPKYNETA